MTQVVVCGEGRAGRGGVGAGRPAALSVGQLVSLCTALSFLLWRLLLLFGGWILLSCAQIFWLNIKYGAYCVTYIFLFISNNLCNWGGGGVSLNQPTVGGWILLHFDPALCVWCPLGLKSHVHPGLCNCD